FGMFVHWGHASQRGLELSWPLVGGTRALPQCQDLPVADYYRTTRTFDPRPDTPRDWARIPPLPRCRALPVPDYYRPPRTFDPRPDSPRDWARIPRRTGMRYAVLTTKH